MSSALRKAPLERAKEQFDPSDLSQGNRIPAKQGRPFQRLPIREVDASALEAGRVGDVFVGERDAEGVEEVDVVPLTTQGQLEDARGGAVYLSGHELERTDDVAWEICEGTRPQDHQ
jgi:hypothetical protein